MAVRRSTRILLVLFTLGVAFAVWLGWYAQDKGFTHNWRELVHAEFEKRGIHATIRRLTLDPMHGLIARDLNLYEDPEHRILLMSIDEVSLDIDLTKLNSRQMSLRSFDIRDARLSIPLDPARKLRGEQLKIHHLDARILMPEDRIEIVRGSARLGEIEFNLKGSLFRPSQAEEEEEEQGPDFGQSQKQHLKLIRERRKQIASILQPLTEIQFAEGADPRIEIEVQGDIEQPEEIRASGTVSCGAAIWREFSMTELSGRFEYQEGVLTMDDLLLRDQHGKLVSRVVLRPADSRMDFSLDSGIDLPALVQAVAQNPMLKEVVFYKPPLVRLEGTLFLDEEVDPQLDRLPLEAIGSVRMDTVASRGVIMDGMSFDFSVDRHNLYLRNGRLNHKTGYLTFDALRDEEGFRYEADMRMDPTVFAPFMAFEGTRQFLNLWEFDEDSAIYLAIEGTGPSIDSRTWTSYGEVDLRNCRLNQSPIDHLQARMELIRDMHHYHDVIISRAEGSLTGRHIVMDNSNLTCQMKGVHGQVLPTHVVGWFAPQAEKQMRVYEFADPPEFEISGRMDLRPPDRIRNDSKHDYTIAFRTDSAAAYELFGKRLEVWQPSGVVHVKEDTVRLTDFRASTLGGKLNLELGMDNLYHDPSWSATLAATDLEFRQLADLYSLESDTEGKFSATFTGQGKVDNFQSMVAEGSAMIEEGNIFSIPLFGPLSRPVASNLPKLSRGLSTASEARVDYRIENAVFHAEQFAARTKAFLVKGEGEVDLETDEIAFNVTMNFRGAPGIVLKPVSQLLAFQAAGSLSEPVWRPRALPKNIDASLEEVQKITGGAIRGAGDFTGDAVRGAGNMTGDALREAGSATTGALREAGRSLKSLPFGKKRNGGDRNQEEPAVTEDVED